ncbi:hypothetical protein Tco_0422071 [Tanacetum coccineum]
MGIKTERELVRIKIDNENAFWNDFEFWQTATVSTLDNGEMEITATIDGKVKIVTEASIRRHLKLKDFDGISNLPTTEIFEQLALMGNMRRASKGYAGVDIPLFPTMLVQGPVVQDEAASTGVDVRLGGATTTVTGLEARQGSGNIDKTPTMPHDSPLLRVHTLGSDEDRMQHNELMDLVTKLSNRVVALETDLTQTKKIYGALFTKLIKKVKTLEKTVKSSQARRKARIIVSDEEEDLEDPSKQGRKIAEIDEPDISLVQHDVEVQGRHDHDMEPDFEFTTPEEVYTAEKGVSTAEPVSTAGASLEQERLDDIQARVEADEEFAQRLQSEEREMYTVAEKARLLVELINERKRYFAAQIAEERRNKPLTKAQQRTYMSQYIKNMRSHTLKQLKSYSVDEIKNLFETTMRRVHTFVPMESESERVIPELAAGSSKRDAKEELVQESSKRQKIRESSEPAEEPKDKEEEELSQERIHQMIIIVPEQGMNVEALQTKYLIIDWEIYTEGARKEDLVKLWSLVKEKFTSTEPTKDKEREIWVELKRLFEPDKDDELWKLQKHIHDIT